MPSVRTHPALCGSVAAHASKVGQSVHNAVYKKMGLAFSYVAFGVEADGKSIIDAMRTLGLRGLAVAMPYKETVIPHLDRLDPLAEEIGAVNTIVNDDGLLTGYNVDWLGAMRGLEENGVAIEARRCVVAGAGGAARAVAFGLKQRGARSVTIFNRTAERGEKLAAELGVSWGGAPNEITDDFDILVHATAAGHVSQPGLSIIPATVLSEGRVVYDIVPEPLKTPLLEKAEKSGCHCVPGYHMRLHQAAAQIELYTGAKPPVDYMEKVLLEAMGLA